MTAASQRPIRIATRASNLAVWQARHVAELLHRAVPERIVELVEVTTTGDSNQIQPLSQFGSLGVFTREIQKAVLDDRADLAVHSLKDLPTETTPDLTLAAIPERGSMFDALVLPNSQQTDAGLDALPNHARVGTGSLRRRAQLLHRRSDLDLLEIRGNVETRLRKLDEGQYEALVLAEAGLQRLGLQDRISYGLRPPEVYPAVGQGAIGIECRANDAEIIDLLQAITDPPTQNAVTAERALLAALRAGCHAPVGVFAQQENDRLSLEAVVLNPDGQQRLFATATASCQVAKELGQLVATDLIAQGADALINSAEKGRA